MLTELEINELKKFACETRKNIVKMVHNAKSGHPGGSLSAADIMAVLYNKSLNIPKEWDKSADFENRDRFILSKGHASAVTSFNQAAIGCFSTKDVINEYATDQGRFSMHSCNLVNPYVEVSTGSLGHGLPIACGIAAALRVKGNNTSRVYTVMGDGEQSEGSIWESVMNAYHYQLGNLVAVVDNNGLEADGGLNDITGLNDIAEKYKSFGWNVVEIDGNSVEQIKNAFDYLPSPTSLIPTVIVAHTTKGKGVPFMENNNRWHAGKITDEQLQDAINHLNQEYESRWDI